MTTIDIRTPEGRAELRALAERVTPEHLEDMHAHAERCRVYELVAAVPSVLALLDEVERLWQALAFARSCIKSGEPWTDTCENVIDDALALDAKTVQK